MLGPPPSDCLVKLPRPHSWRFTVLSPLLKAGVMAMGPSPNSRFSRLSSTRGAGNASGLLHLVLVIQCLQIHTSLLGSFMGSHFLDASIKSLRCQAAVHPPHPTPAAVGGHSQGCCVLDLLQSVISKEPTDVSRSYVKCLVDGIRMLCMHPVKPVCFSTWGMHHSHLGLFFLTSTDAWRL